MGKRLLRKMYYRLRMLWELCYFRYLYSPSVLMKPYESRQLLIGDNDDIKSIGDRYRTLFPERIKEIVTEADVICDHIFDLLGSGPKKLSAEGMGYLTIDWHADFKSGHRWDQHTFFGNIKCGHNEGVDIKVPWELSRFQHLNILGQAFLLTHDKKYAYEFRDQISDWIEHNPVGFGVNWCCTMDVAIRASNWLVVQEYFAETGLLSPEFWEMFYTSMYDHGKFISNHLENYSNVISNHYISDLVGLFFISIYCPFLNESTAWQKIAVRELESEIEKQVYADGCDFEASTSYHRLVLELLFYSLVLGERAGVAFSEVYKGKIRKMFEFSLYCIKPNGRIPQIGDNDSGRFLIFRKRPILEHNYLLIIAAIYYKDSTFKLPSCDFDEEAFWIFGNTGRECFERLSYRQKPITSKEFPDAGWYIMRSGNNYCFISCGSNGQGGYGGHAHNDKLSIELMLDGHDIVVDPGSFIYTPYPEERNLFRSTAYHNTVSFDNCEQNEISSNIFRLRNRVIINDVCMTENETQIVFKGDITYAGITHKRIIMLEKKTASCTIFERYIADKKINGSLRFNVPPDCTVKDATIFKKESNEKIASIELRGQQWETRVYDYSPEYGKKGSATCLIAHVCPIKDGYEITIRRM